MEVYEQVVDSIPNSFLKKHIDSGKQGDCYLTEDNKLFKHYKDGVPNYQELKFIADRYQCEHLALPETFLFLKSISEENFIGFVRKYVDGQRFSQLSDKIKVSSFVKALCDMEKELLYNSRYGLEYFDLHEDNILYTHDDEIKVIDQGMYFVSYGDEFRRLAKENCYCLVDTIIPVFYGSIHVGIDSVDELISRATGFNSFIRPSEMLEESIYEIEKRSCEEIATIGDFKRNLKLAKEKILWRK